MEAGEGARSCSAVGHQPRAAPGPPQSPSPHGHHHLPRPAVSSLLLAPARPPPTPAGEGSECDLPRPIPPPPPPPPPPHTPTTRAPAAARATERLAPARVRLRPQVRAHPFPHRARAPTPHSSGFRAGEVGLASALPNQWSCRCRPLPSPCAPARRPGLRAGPAARAGPEAGSPGASRASPECRGLRSSWVAFRSPHLPQGAVPARGCTQLQHSTRLEPQPQRHLARLRPVQQPRQPCSGPLSPSPCPAVRGERLRGAGSGYPLGHCTLGRGLSGEMRPCDPKATPTPSTRAGLQPDSTLAPRPAAADGPLVPPQPGSPRSARLAPAGQASGPQRNCTARADCLTGPAKPRGATQATDALPRPPRWDPRLHPALGPRSTDPARPWHIHSLKTAEGQVGEPKPGLIPRFQHPPRLFPVPGPITSRTSLPRSRQEVHLKSNLVSRARSVSLLFRESHMDRH
ncbi:nascent polypeptide-associated complex subunit alpha, muscle-specific form-like [Sciurus carolinensis]|uniref:nascent polypeptide-associated complex subunit alpha, muscle-specific form-like n=1 Tax=Sciurus carolinensis TaxID=30640 RepID=UPI001FB280F1|nr:nascent polypeptide-associated complex subunit alpha, muscle-specific form-like [Sciurus carolinensis]